HGPAPIYQYIPEVFVEELYVSPDSRRTGIGTALFNAVRDWGASWGARRLRLAVLASNEAARSFWQRLDLSDLSITMALPLPGAEEVEERRKSRIGFGV